MIKPQLIIPRFHPAFYCTDIINIKYYLTMIKPQLIIPRFHPAFYCTDIINIKYYLTMIKPQLTIPRFHPAFYCMDIINIKDEHATTRTWLQPIQPVIPIIYNLKGSMQKALQVRGEILTRSAT